MKVGEIMCCRLFTIIVLLSMCISVYAQQPQTDLSPTSLITKENVGDLEPLVTLGAGKLYAIDWHPNGEILALGRGSGTCLLNQALEITQCLPENEATYDVAWNESGDRLAIVTGTKLKIYQFDILTTTFTEISMSLVDVSSDCVAWNDNDEIVVADHRFEDDIVVRVLSYEQSTNELNLLDNTMLNRSEGLLSLLDMQCFADTDKAQKTLRIAYNWFAGRSYHFILHGSEFSDQVLAGRLGSFRDVSWHIPNETFTYIEDNQLVNFSLLQYSADAFSGEVLRSTILGTSFVNRLLWSSDGNQLLSAHSYGDVVNIWSSISGFKSDDIVNQSINVSRGRATNEASIDWIDNTHFSFELVDWYGGTSTTFEILNTVSGERDLIIRVWVSYPEEQYPTFYWNPSFTVYALFTEDGLQLTRLEETTDFIGYDSEIGDFNLDIQHQDYIFPEISCDSEGWIDDRYFQCIAQGEVIQINSLTGDTISYPYVSPEPEETFYEVQFELNDTDFNNSLMRVIDMISGKVTVEETITILPPASIEVKAFDTLGIIVVFLEDEIQFWHVSSGEKLFTLEGSKYISVDLHPNGHLIAVGTTTGLVHLYGVAELSE